jgi:DNA polymerase II large subunit
MTPAPHVLFPVGFQGAKDRNLTGQYAPSRFGRQGGNTVVEIARYRCKNCGARLDTPYCYKCKRSASLEYFCSKCGLAQSSPVCSKCGGETSAYEQREVDFHKLVADAVARLGYAKTPKQVKGVKGLTNRNKVAEPIEKGILRSMFNVMVFKDGTARFDATDTPMTHFYPSEIGVSVEKLRELGYTHDYEGRELTSSGQLVELRHQDVILNKRGADYLVNISKFVDEMLQRLYGMQPFYNMSSGQDIVGQLVLTLAPHTSCAVLNRVIGLTDANVGFAHPYVISARRRNADGDEDTTMLLLDVLINFSREFLPTSIGSTMDEPLLLVTRVLPQEVDDEVHAMEVEKGFGLDFYNKTFEGASPSEANVELVEGRLKGGDPYNNLNFTHLSGPDAIRESPKKSEYTLLKTMDEKIDEEFRIMDMLESIDKRDAAKRLINSHFIRDLTGNLHSYSKQQFRCVSCNSHYRRVPLSGKCTRCGGKLLLTISKGSIEKYMNTATKLADRYGLDTYTKQRLQLIKGEIDSVFGSYEINAEENRGQFNLVNFM